MVNGVYKPTYITGGPHPEALSQISEVLNPVSEVELRVVSPLPSWNMTGCRER